MKVSATIVFCLYFSVLEIRGDVFPECNDITEKKFIASKQSCAHYIFCDGDNSYDGDCLDGENFNEAEQMCDSNVTCDDATSETDSGMVGLNGTSSTEIIVTTNTEISATDNSTLAPTTGQNVTLPTPSADGSENVTLATTTTQVVLVASDSSMAQDTTTTTLDVIGSTQLPPISTIVSTTCPTLDDPKRLVFLTNEKSCSSYFVCLSGERVAMQCAAKLHFNPQTGKCDYPENVKCMHGFANAREQCQSDIVDVFPHPRKCNYYYVCQNGYLLLSQCPYSYGWDYERRSCVEIAKATCYNNANRF